MRYFEHSLHRAFPKFRKFPSTVRNLFEINRNMWNPDEGLLYVQLIRRRSAKVLKSVSGVTREYEFSHWRDIFLCATFVNFPVWFLCGNQSTVEQQTIIDEVQKTPSRLIDSARVLGTRYKSQGDLYTWIKLLSWYRHVFPVLIERLAISEPVISWDSSTDFSLNPRIYPRHPDYGSPSSSESDSSDSSPGHRPCSSRYITLSSDTEADGPSAEAAAIEQRSPPSQAPTLPQRPLSPYILQDVEPDDFRCQPLSPKRVRRATPDLPVAIVTPNPREPEAEEVALHTPLHGPYDDYPDDIPSPLRILSPTDWETAERLYSPADDNDLQEL